MALPSQVIIEDHDLEDRVGRMSEKLAKLRWHWTLDESNPERVKVSEYAKAVGKAWTTIDSYAKGYDIFTRIRGTATIGESIERAKMGVETAAATEAVTRARGGTSLQHTRQTRPTEIKRVREIARERAEKHGTTVEEEAPKVAKAIVQAEKAGKQVTAHRKERLGLRFIEMERKLDRVKRELVDAVRLAQDLEWGTEETELLQHTLGNIKALLHLIDMALIGSTDVDWDNELAKLTEERI